MAKKPYKLKLKIIKSKIYKNFYMYQLYLKFYFLHVLPLLNKTMLSFFCNYCNIKMYSKDEKYHLIRINEVENHYLLEVKRPNFKQRNSLVINKAPKKNYFTTSLFKTCQSTFIERNE